MYQKLLYILIILFANSFVNLSVSLAQNKDLKDKLVAKRWGLSYFIEQNGALYDTLIRVHDCQNEYIEITANGKFLSTDLRKEGTWQLNNDVLTLKKQGGGIYKNLVITRLTEDSLIVTDKKRKSDDVFIEVYRVCDINDTTFKDTREIKEVRKSWGLIAGVQQFKATYLELGIARTKFEWNNVFYAMSLNLELAPWKNGNGTNFNYGTSINFWSEDIIFYGVGAVGYNYLTKNAANQDISNFAFGLRPMLGISAARILGNSNLTAHLYYSYNFFLTQNKLEYVNQHAITFRIFVPVLDSVQKVRRIVRQGVEY